MPSQELEVELRKELGKEEVGRLRKKGKLPGIFYGKGVEPQPVIVEQAQVLRILHSPTGKNTILTLRSSEQKLEGKRVLIREHQVDAITDQLIHIDLMAVEKDRLIRVKVPVEMFGKPVGAEKGGTLEEHIWELEISCLPDEIPEVIKVDVSNLDLGDSIYVRDLNLGNLKVLTDLKQPVVTVVAPAKVEEVAPAVTAEGAVPAEGEAPAEPGTSGEKVEKAEKEVGAVEEKAKAKKEPKKTE